MRTKIRFTVTFALILGLLSLTFAQKQQPPKGGKPKDFNLPQKTTFTLDNGLKVTLVPYGSLPKVTVGISVRAGNLNEKENQVWLADLTGDYLKEGTTSRSAKEVAEQAANMGGDISVNVGEDQTFLFGDVLSEFGPQLVDLMADVIKHPAFPESELERLKTNLIRNLHLSKSQPQMLAREQFLKALYDGHPYGRMFPTEEMIRRYTIDDVKSFYQDNFGARRTHLYVAGRFDQKAVEAAICKAFGDWKEGPEPLIDIPKPRSGRIVYLLDRPGAPQSTIYIGLPVIDPSNPDYLPLLVTNTLLGGSFASRITSNIREDKGYTYSPRSMVSTHYRDAYWVEAADVTTKYTGASLKEIIKEVKRLQNEPPAKEELEGIQNYMAGTFVLRNSTRQGIIGQLAFLDLHGLPDSYLTNFVKNVYAVTPEKVQEMTRKYLKDQDMIIVVVGDKKVVKKQLTPFGKVVMP